VLVLLAGLMAAAGVALAGLAVAVWRRRAAAAGLSLAVLLLAVAWWGVTYAVELSTTDLGVRSAWGDLKYAGIVAVAPAWLVFVLRYTGRGRRVTPALLAALAVEPVAVLTLLAVPATHDWVRWYPPSEAGQALAVAEVGWAFWVHAAYSNALVVLATGLFVTSMVRISHLYRRLSAVLIVAAVLPLLVNALHNFDVGPFTRLDLTPFVFVATGGVLVWGLWYERLVDLMPLARGAVVESMGDPVIVLDGFGHVVDVNPAAVRLLGGRRRDLAGRDADDVLPAGVRGPSGEVALDVGGSRRLLEPSRHPVRDRSGAVTGEVVVLRDVTERRAAEERLRELLAERTRVAAALQASLVPRALPDVPGVSLAGLYRPAGDGREIGGDFLDVFGLGGGAWGVVLGDVSGKGADAAAFTALIRGTVRALASEGRSPVSLLSSVNEVLLGEGDDERFCTMALALARPGAGGVDLDLCLGGHHPPLLLRADGSVGPVGETGTALGLLEHPRLAQTHLRLGPGDTMLWFTDGLVEARRGTEEFGEQRAAEVLREHACHGPVRAAEMLEAAVRLFRGGPLSDDLAVLVLGVDGGGEVTPPVGAPRARAVDSPV
jgi:PAS domain S-box-containing protein